MQTWGSPRKELSLTWTCVTCRGKVARMLEEAARHEALQPGDKVIWWKCLLGGDDAGRLLIGLTSDSRYMKDSMASKISPNHRKSRGRSPDHVADEVIEAATDCEQLNDKGYRCSVTILTPQGTPRRVSSYP